MMLPCVCDANDLARNVRMYKPAQIYTQPCPHQCIHFAHQPIAVMFFHQWFVFELSFTVHNDRIAFELEVAIVRPRVNVRVWVATHRHVAFEREHRDHVARPFDHMRHKQSLLCVSWVHATGFKHTVMQINSEWSTIIPMFANSTPYFQRIYDLIKLINVGSIAFQSIKLIISSITNAPGPISASSNAILYFINSSIRAIHSRVSRVYLPTTLSRDKLYGSFGSGGAKKRSLNFIIVCMLNICLTRQKFTYIRILSSFRNSFIA